MRARVGQVERPRSRSRIAGRVGSTLAGAISPADVRGTAGSCGTCARRSRSSCRRSCARSSTGRSTPGRVPRMREEAAGRHVDGVDAGLDEPLADLDRVRRACCPTARGSEQRQRVVVTRSALIFICRWKSSPTRARIARTISSTKRARFSSEPPYSSVAVVDRRAEELRDQVAVGAVQLDAVEPGLARAPRALGERGDDLLDLRRSVIRSHSKPCSGSRLVGRAEPLRILDAADVALPAAVAELQDEPAVVLVHGARRPPARTGCARRRRSSRSWARCGRAGAPARTTR